MRYELFKSGVAIALIFAPIQFELTSLTQRRTILDPGKLAFLNRQHLILKSSTSGDLEALTTRAEVFVKQAYPDR